MYLHILNEVSDTMRIFNSSSGGNAVSLFVKKGMKVYVVNASAQFMPLE